MYRYINPTNAYLVVKLRCHSCKKMDRIEISLEEYKDFVTGNMLEIHIDLEASPFDKNAHEIFCRCGSSDALEEVEWYMETGIN